MTVFSSKQEKLRKQILSTPGFVFYLVTQLPMGLLAGLRVVSLETYTCVTSVPFKWLNKNPFKSTYFAVQSMAAELSTAVPCLMAITDQKPSIAFIIVDLKATFLKKATGRVFFTCQNVDSAYRAVALSKETNTPQVVSLTTIGKMKDGTIVSEFEFTWSFKVRSS